MITQIKDVFSENPTKQIWKFLRFFLDEKSTVERIRTLHNTDNNNVNKQAAQIAYCIRQAEEYFHASSQVGLATRPNLLYYGAVSLSRALILLRRDGNYSFDSLRKTERHKHHGLELIGTTDSTNVESFFRTLQCKIHTKNSDKSNTEPWGNFPLFYETLVPGANIVPQEIYRKRHDRPLKDVTFLQRKSLLSQMYLTPIDLLIPRVFSSINAFKNLPDMYHALQEFDINTELCRGSSKAEITFHYSNLDEPEEKLEKIITEHHFFMNGLSQNQSDHLRDYFAKETPDLKMIADMKSNFHLQATIEDFPPTSKSYQVPDIVDDINTQLFFVTKPEQYISEPASYLMVLFCLSMLCRYYPDVWMKVIDKNIQITELTDTFLTLAYRKFPNLILDQLTLTKHFIHQ